MTWLLVGFGLPSWGWPYCWPRCWPPLGVTTDALRTAAAVVLGLAGERSSCPGWAAAGRPLIPPGAPRWRGGGRGPMIRPASRRRHGCGHRAALGPLRRPAHGGGHRRGRDRRPVALTVLVGSAYVVGAAIPLGLVAWGGQRAAAAMGTPRRRATLQRSFGVLMVLSAALILTGLDLPVEAAVSAVVPANIGVGASPADDAALNPTPGAVALEDLGPAPELTGITAWINAAPLTMARCGARSCWSTSGRSTASTACTSSPTSRPGTAQYASAGLVVIGVTSRTVLRARPGNVRQAVAQDGAASRSLSIPPTPPGMPMHN